MIFLSVKNINFPKHLLINHFPQLRITCHALYTLKKKVEHKILKYQFRYEILVPENIVPIYSTLIQVVNVPSK